MAVRLAWAAIVAMAASQSASESAASPDCYDALVSARIVGQTPVPVPDCGDDCIIMSWPWFLELDVDRVLRGRATTGRLSVLSIQHTYFRSDLGVRRWWLRRHALGGFNVVRLDRSERLPRCARGTPPANPYLRPGNGRTLRDELQDAERVRGSSS